MGVDGGEDGDEWRAASFTWGDWPGHSIARILTSSEPSHVRIARLKAGPTRGHFPQVRDPPRKDPAVRN
jgi:hypothetical protein